MTKYHTRNNCRLCKSTKLIKVVDFGVKPLAGNFLKEKNVGKEDLYPVRLYRCEDCTLVQITDVVDPKVLFKDYHYLSAIPLGGHFKEYAKDVSTLLNKGDLVVDIGSNDGTFMDELDKLGVNTLGVDPAINIVSKVKRTIADYFTPELAKDIKEQHGRARVIFANNVLAHIDDVDSVIAGVKNLLAGDGMFIFEVYYLGDTIEKTQYDYIYNEHLSYYSIRSLLPYLSSHGLTIFDVKRISTHGGSIRVYCQNNEGGKRNIHDQVNNLLVEEEYLSNEQTYIDFSNRIQSHRDELKNTLVDLKNSGNKIVGYGASGRAVMLLSFCDIDTSIMDYIIDESPERYGHYTPLTHIPIYNKDKLDKEEYDYVFITAWNYKDMILTKNPKIDKYIIPFPQIEIGEK